MQLVQFLTCNDTLGTCCSDYTLVNLLDIVRKLMELIQLIVPIILIVMATIQLGKMMISPEEEKLKKSLYNKFLAAFFVFIIPVIIDAVLNLLPESYSLSSCWEKAKVSAEIVRSQKNSYIAIDDKTTKASVIGNYDDYENGTSDSESSSQGSATGEAIVNYAKKFVGSRYVWGGTWNGESPYTATDCSGFVQGVFRHFGINLTRSTYSQWDDKASYTLVTGEIKPGDLIMYDGHVGILTGNGREIVHNKSPRYGVCIDKDYKKCSSHAILGIMRIKGVN